MSWPTGAGDATNRRRAPASNAVPMVPGPVHPYGRFALVPSSVPATANCCCTGGWKLAMFLERRTILSICEIQADLDLMWLGSLGGWTVTWNNDEVGLLTPWSVAVVGSCMGAPGQTTEGGLRTRVLAGGGEEE